MDSSANIIKAMGIMVILDVMAQVSYGEVYKVGDSAGWTTMGNVDYKLWSATKTFKVGDIIRFEYNPRFHNVMRVTHAMYKACNASMPVESYTTGNDSVAITGHGHHFFICGVPGHCQAGQKVDINVPRKVSPVAAPAPSIFVSPSVPIAAKTPSPAPNSAASQLRSRLNPLLASVVALAFGFSTLV